MIIAMPVRCSRPSAEPRCRSALCIAAGADHWVRL